jgi:hypothetical protein
MSRPVSEWDEAYILSLPENDEFERKGAMLLDLKAGADENAVLDELAKQLSAFANTGGGRIIYGIERDGSIKCGGVSTDIKPGGTKEWLERKIPSLTEYEIVGFSVDEFTPSSQESHIAPGKALYVITVPDSERAPHQSVRNKKYYIRNGSQSEAARHRIIEDIRNRQKHPNVSLALTKIQDINPRQPEADHAFYAVDTTLVLTVINSGVLKSTDTFVLLEPGLGQFGVHFDKEIVTVVKGTKPGQIQWQLNRPLPPQSEISFRADYHFQARCLYHPSFGPTWTLYGEERSLDDVSIQWSIFADSAPVSTQRVTLRDSGIIKALNLAVKR